MELFFIVEMMKLYLLGRIAGVASFFCDMVVVSSADEFSLMSFFIAIVVLHLGYIDCDSMFCPINLVVFDSFLSELWILHIFLPELSTVLTKFFFLQLPSFLGISQKLDSILYCPFFGCFFLINLLFFSHPTTRCL